MHDHRRVAPEVGSSSNSRTGLCGRSTRTVSRRELRASWITRRTKPWKLPSSRSSWEAEPDGVGAIDALDEALVAARCPSSNDPAQEHRDGRDDDEREQGPNTDEWVQQPHQQDRGGAEQERVAFAREASGEELHSPGAEV